VIVQDMTSIRINWLKAFEQAHGRKVVVTRQELLAFHANAPQTGGLGMPIKYPSWLTNPKPNKWIPSCAIVDSVAQVSRLKPLTWRMWNERA